MASGAEVLFQNQRIPRCMLDARGALAASRKAVLQIGDNYRLERKRGTVLWDVVWIGPFNRLFTRLRIESPSATLLGFALVHRDVDALHPVGLSPHASRLARRSGFRLYGDLPLHRDARIALLAAMKDAKVAVLGVEPTTAWTLVYDVRFEPDQFEKCVTLVESIAPLRDGPYR
jgi:hypothetical protein